MFVLPAGRVNSAPQTAQTLLSISSKLLIPMHERSCFIELVLGHDGPALVLSESRKQAEAALEQLKAALADCPNTDGSRAQ